MLATRSERRTGLGWLPVSLVLHALFVFRLPVGRELPEGPAFELPDQIEFGVTQTPGDEGPAGPPPAAAAAPEPVVPRAPKIRVKAPPVPVAAPPPEAAAIAVSRDAGAEDSAEEPAGEAADEPESAAAVSGTGLFPGATGSGAGAEGSGSGGGVSGATIALNVDLERVRNSALLLETQALLDIIPEWQALLAGSGLDAVHDFRRVFVAAPSLDRAALIVSAEHRLTRSRIGAAVSTLASERGLPASFSEHAGVSVAAWRNRGPTERVIALTARDQLLITRGSELARVLAVSRSLGALRKRQGFDASEVDTRGGLLAMQPDEAVALWVEGVARYVRGADPNGVPESLRLSIFRFDQFHTELAVSGNYRSPTAAESALAVMEGLRRELSNHPRVVFLGLKSALDAAQIERQDGALRLRVRLTLHQTRYLLGYVSRILRPRPQP